MKIIKIPHLIYMITFAVILTSCVLPEGDTDGHNVYAGSGSGSGGGGGPGGGGVGLRQLTTDPAPTEGSTPYRPRLSGDSSTVIFTTRKDHVGSNSDDTVELFIMKITGLGLVQLTDLPVSGSSANPVTLYDLSNDGSVVVFAGELDHLGTGANTDFGSEIFIINGDGSGLDQITNGLTITDNSTDPQISSDGTLISYIAGGQIFTYDTGTTNTATIGSLSNVLSQSLSGDGSKIVFCSDANLSGGNSDFTQEVFVIDTDGTNLTQLTASATSSCYPEISDDGSTVAFVSKNNTGGTNQLFVIESNGTNLEQLTDSNFGSGVDFYKQVGIGDSYPHAGQISGNGNVIVFSTTQGGSSIIALANTDGSGLNQLSPLTTNASYWPTVSNNADVITFTSDGDLVDGENTARVSEVFVDTDF